MDKWKARRRVVKAQFTRIETYINNLENVQLDESEITLRLGNLTKLLNEYNEIQIEIELLEGDEVVGHEEDREHMEDRYYSVSSKASKMLKKLGPSDLVATNIARTITDDRSEHGAELQVAIQTLIGHQTTLADLIRNAPANSNLAGNSNTATNFQQHNNNHSEVRLKPIEVPSFNGDYKKWPEFNDLFKNLVHNNARLSPCEKLQYLKQSLTEKAQGVLANVTISDANYEHAYEQLVNTFDKKDVLIDAYLLTIMDQVKVNTATASNLQTLINSINEAVRALKALGMPTQHWDRWLVFVVASKLDNESNQLWRRDCASKVDNASYEKLVEFINNRVYELSTTKASKDEPKQVSKTTMNTNSRCNHSATTALAAATATSNSKGCYKCNGEHGVYVCQEFLAMTIADRRDFVNKKKLCYNCMKSNHNVKECSSKSSCRICNKRHNTLLHVQQHEEGTHTGQRGSTLKTATCAVTQQPSTCMAILPTAIVLAKNSSGQYERCRVLLDTGSQINLVSEKCAQRLQLTRRNARVLIHGVGSVQTNSTKGKVDILLKSRFSDFELTTQALILKNVTSYIPEATVKQVPSQILQQLQLADPQYSCPQRIDMIIGCNIFFQVLLQGRKEYGENNQIAIETKFGWVMSGEGVSSEPNEVISNHTCIDIDESLKLFWQTEELLHDEQYNEEELLAEEHYIKTVKREENGRYIVELPFKSTSDVLGASKNAAIVTLKAMERRFLRDTALENQYGEFIDEYMQLNHMSEIKGEDQQVPEHQSYYMPHHSVLKEHSSTTKLRVVFDASRKTSTGVALNDLLMVGPTIQPNIWTLLLKFRRHKIAYIADIAKMYRQILVSQHNTPYQRIMWRDKNSGVIKEYELKTVTYGTASAPFLAVRTLKQLADDEGYNYPAAKNVLLNNFYVDDLMSGSDSVQEAIAVKDQLIGLLQKGGFCLRKWVSNSTQLLSTIDEEHVELVNSYPVEENNSVKALGLKWHPSRDIFQFNVLLDAMQQYTKRNVLSEISKLYDPLGLVSPCTVVSKLIMQQIWLAGVGWDDPLPESIRGKYEHFRNQLKLLVGVKITRWVNITPNSTLQLIGFADASEVAYAAVIYVKVIKDEHVSVHLLTSKTRIAPINQISLPRLELCAAHLLARLMEKVQVALNCKEVKIFAFSDSTIVLAWLKAIPRRWKTFIANRTSHILSIIPYKCWRHVRSAENAADRASRGVSAAELLESKEWWYGPQFVRSTDFTNTQSPQNVETALESRAQSSLALHTTIHHGVQTELETLLETLVANYSSLTTLTRVLARCLRFIANLKLKVNKLPVNTLPLSAMELQVSTDHLIKMAQLQEFEADIKLLNLKRSVSQMSKLKNLMPIIDAGGILRVGGRIQNALLSESRKHPILLGKMQPLTQLIIRDIHMRYFHANPQLMMSIINTKYWVIGGKLLVRKCIRKCTTCMRYRAEGYCQQMGNLPGYRVQPSRPFSNTGTDYAGPFQVRAWKGRGAKQFKCYVIIFVCMAIKAVHLELCSDLSTDTFLAALHRFTSRRGICNNIYSDNGRNYVGAARKLTEYQEFLHKSQEQITKDMASNEITWHFIPAYSPNFGGLWEAAVKAMKHHLKRAIGEQTLTYEEMATILSQIEACLNSRPLGIAMAAVDNLEPLTPGHFLTQGPILLPLQEDEANMTIATRWKLIQRIQMSFWKRWSLEYISTLQTRKKWADRNNNITVDDIVLVKEDNMPPCRWLMGRVIDTHPGSDGLVRVATLKTKSGTIKRAVRKLVVFLPKESHADVTTGLKQPSVSRRAECCDSIAALSLSKATN